MLYNIIKQQIRIINRNKRTRYISILFNMTSKVTNSTIKNILQSVLS
jgi:hypothetical protein